MSSGLAGPKLPAWQTLLSPIDKLRPHLAYQNQLGLMQGLDLEDLRLLDSLPCHHFRNCKADRNRFCTSCGRLMRSMMHRK